MHKIITSCAQISPGPGKKLMLSIPFFTTCMHPCLYTVDSRYSGSLKYGHVPLCLDREGWTCTRHQ